MKFSVCPTILASALVAWGQAGPSSGATSDVRESSAIFVGTVLDSPRGGIPDFVFPGVFFAAIDSDNEHRAVTEFDLSSLEQSDIGAAYLKVQPGGVSYFDPIPIPVQVFAFSGDGSLQLDDFDAGSFIGTFDVVTVPFCEQPILIDVTDFLRSQNLLNVVGFNLRVVSPGVSVSFGPAPPVLVVQPPGSRVTVDLGTLGGTSSYAQAVNASGQVVGYSFTSGGYHAFSWTQSDGMIDLGTLGGTFSYVHAVNASGQVVGWSHTSGGEQHAFSWTQSDGMIDLGTLGGTFSSAAAVNDNGQVVGFSGTTAGEPHAFSWTQSGGMIDLGSLSSSFSVASAVNASGQVIGYSSARCGSEVHAVLWQASVPAPIKVWVGLKNSDDVGIRFDLRAKVFSNGSPVGSGTLNSVAGGSSGFNNAKLNTIPLTMTAPVSKGDTLRIEILARNACSGSGKNSGTARLWYNGQPIDSGPARDAGSRFNRTGIDPPDQDYFLREGSTLSTTSGTSRLFVDKAAGAKCSPFASFGSWSVTLP